MGTFVSGVCKLTGNSVMFVVLRSVSVGSH